MSLAISTLFSPNPSLRPPSPHFSSQTRLYSRTRNHVIPFRSSSIHKPPFVPQYTRNLLHSSASTLGYSIGGKRVCRASSKNGESDSKSVDHKTEEEFRRSGTMPDRFRLKEVPESSIRWPWFVALGFLLYAWRTVLWELSNWKNAAANIVLFVGYLLKLALALIFHFIGDPITSLIRGVETSIYAVRGLYSTVVAYTPIRELTVIIVLVSSILAIAEAAVPGSVDGQYHLLTVAGITGFAAMGGFLSDLSFWTLLLGLFAFVRVIKKRDYVSSVLPVAAVLTAVGEPWVRFVVMISYLALAITHHSKKPSSEHKVEGESVISSPKVPFPLLCAGLAIGVRVAAKWAGYRHLTWMIV